MSGVALVVGATGLVGGAMVRALAEQGWHVVALARRQLDTSTIDGQVSVVSVDLYQPSAVKEALAPFAISHVFFCAHYSGTVEDGGWYPSTDFEMRHLTHVLGFSGVISPFFARHFKEPYYKLMSQRSRLNFVDENMGMLTNTINAVDGPDLQQVLLITGGRYYGQQMGPMIHPDYSTPFREDQPRVPGENWYYVAEDYLKERAEKAGWGWTVLRPSTVLGYCPGAPFSFGPALAVYATLLKAMGLPLLYPSSPKSYQVQNAFSGARELTELAIWSMTDSAGRNQAYNASSGYSASWQTLWPQVAEYFDMPFEGPSQAFCLPKFFDGRERVWPSIAAHHDLVNADMESLMSPIHLSQALCVEWDATYSQEKLNKAGYHLDQQPMDAFVELFEDLKDKKVIPK